MTAKKTMKRGTGLAATARDATVTPETIKVRAHVPGPTVATVQARAGFETIGPGLSVPRRATIRFTHAPVDVVMDVELVADHYEVVRLELLAHEGKITGAELRGIAVATLLREGVRVLLPFAEMALQPRTEPVPREELLDEVAAVYLIARLAGEDPVATCVEVFGRSRPTVASWITRARKEGLIK